jgi:hypothetical protein
MTIDQALKIFNQKYEKTYRINGYAPYKNGYILLPKFPENLPIGFGGFYISESGNIQPFGSGALLSNIDILKFEPI